MAEKLNYRPNVAARSLKLNRSLHIGAYVPQQIASFFAPLRAGISAAGMAAHGLNLDIEFRTYPSLGDGDLELMQTDLDRGYDGVIITPGDPARIDPIIRRLTQQGTAVVCVATDAPRSDRVAAISVDAGASGGIAAELLGKTVKQHGYRGHPHRPVGNPGPRGEITRICRHTGHPRAPSILTAGDREPRTSRGGLSIHTPVAAPQAAPGWHLRQHSQQYAGTARA